MDWTAKNKKTPGEIAQGEHFARRKNISEHWKTKTFLMVLFLVFSFVFFLTNSNGAKAASVNRANCEAGGNGTWTPSGIIMPDNNGTCVCKSGTLSATGFCGGVTTTAAEQACIDSGGTKLSTNILTEGSIGKCIGCEDKKNADGTSAGLVTGAGAGSVCQTKAARDASYATVSPAADAHGGSVKTAECGTTDFACYFKMLLVGVLNFMGWLFAIAATLFAWVINPDNVSGPNGMLNKQAVKDVWVMVRDLLNMSFILILLFAAFCTIFQVEKWNLKKVWLNILINALLVNFSFPIARFFIDISNVAFYYFVNHLFVSTGTSTVVTGSSIFASFGASSNMGPLLAPPNYTQFDIAYLIAMIVITFIMGMTLLVIAALFVVRLIALTMLIMFSPIGFVGYIFPSTSSYADDWWKNLFSYSFFAPIMIFIMAIALRITTAMGQENMQAFVAGAGANAMAKDAPWLANAAFITIPIIILWMGMGVAKSMGIAGADAVVSTAKKGGKWLSGASFVAGTYKAYSARRDQAKGDRWSNRLGTWVGNRQDQLRGVVPGYTGDRAHQRYESAENARITEEAKLRDTANMGEGQLRDIAASGNKYGAAAARAELATKGVATIDDLNAIRNSFGENSQVFRQMQNKVKAYDPTAAFQDAAGNIDWARVSEHALSNQFDFKKMNANSLGNAQFMGTLFDNNLVDAKAIEGVRNTRNGNAVNAGLRALAATRTNTAVGPAGDIDRAIHMAAFAQTGEMVDTGNAAANDALADHVFSRLDKDTGKRMSLATVIAHHNRIANQVKPGAYKAILTNMGSGVAASELNTRMQVAAGSPNADAINHISNTDHDITHIHN